MGFGGWLPVYRDSQVRNGLADFVYEIGGAWLAFYAKLIGQMHPILMIDEDDARNFAYVLEGIWGTFQKNFNLR